MLKYRKLISLIDETSTGASPPPSPSKSKASLDEFYLKALTKAHDDSQHLLNKKYKNIHQLLKPQRKNYFRRAHQSPSMSDLSDVDVCSTSLPINDIPNQANYNSYLTMISEEVNMSHERHIIKYPKLYRFLKQKVQKQQNISILPTINKTPPKQMLKLQRIEYGQNYQDFVTRMSTETSKVEMQQLYDKYQYRKVGKQMYQKLPYLADYDRLLQSQARIIQNKKLGSKLNQEKLEMNLKQIYYQILQNK